MDVNNNLSCEDDIYTRHTDLIRNSEYYSKIIDSIIGDMLMDKISVKKGKIYLTINKRILDLIHGWYDLSSKIVIYNTNNITVYRGVSNMDITYDKIVQPIPFSSCIDFDNSLNWIHIKNPNSFIMKINIKSGVGYTYTGNLDEGNEVVLPAGILLKKNIIEYLEYNVVVYDFEPYTYSQMEKNFDTLFII